MKIRFRVNRRFAIWLDDDAEPLQLATVGAGYPRAALASFIESREEYHDPIFYDDAASVLKEDGTEIRLYVTGHEEGDA